MTTGSKWYNTCLLFAGLLTGSIANGQDGFAWRAPVDAISHTGFYKIPLSPGLLGRCILDGGIPKDLRIISTGEGKPVPYVFQADQAVSSAGNFEALPLIASSIDNKNRLSVAVENKDTQLLSHLVLVIRNTEVCQSITLSGSDDNRQWFVIREHILLNCHFKSVNGQFLQDIDMTPVKYRFFKVTTEGENQLPVNIRKIGTWKSKPAPMPGFISLPEPTLRQRDSSDNISRVGVYFPTKVLIDQLKIGVSGTRFYKREFMIKVHTGGSWHMHGPMLLQTGQALAYPVGEVADSLSIDIINGDNPPLQVSTVSGETANRFLVAYLDSGVQYQLYLGNTRAATPEYDLNFFLDSIGTGIRTATPGRLTAVKDAADARGQGTRKENRWLVWLALGAALLALLFFTFKMTKQIGNNQDESLTEE